MRSSFRPAPPRLITARADVILVIACVIGAVGGALTYLASHSLPQALLAAGIATGDSAKLISQIMGTDAEPAISGQDNQLDNHIKGAQQQRQA